MKRVQVRDQLRLLIEDRPPGELIPSERDLSEQFGVSRPTLRAAIEDLARDGLLVRHHGRGTFTNTRTVPQIMAPTANAAQFTAPPADGNWLNRVEEFRVEQAGPKLGKRMQVSPSDDLLYICRVKIVDGAPMAIEKIRIPFRILPGIESTDFESGSLYQLLQSRFGVIATHAVQTTEPTVTDADESHLLEVPLYAPALLFERTTRDTGGRVIEYARSIYRGDRYRITTHLTFDQPSEIA
jgi:GntR family transcriptional regulator